jgi:hypothetical protein
MDFSEVGDVFAQSSWINFIFTNCHFPASGLIQLKETRGCLFNGCEFGPGRDDVAMRFGAMKNGVFQQCKFTSGNVNFGAGSGGNATFRDCTFEARLGSRGGPLYSLGGDNLNFISCTFRHYRLLCDIKLHMNDCDYLCAGSSSINPYDDYTADFIFEDTKLANAEKLFWNAKFNNLTLKNVQTKGTFATQQSSIKESITLEKLKVGTYYINRSGTEKKITVRECYFSEVNEKSGRLFSCSGDFAREFLMERVEASNAGAVNVTGAGPKTPETIRTVETNNQTFTIRDCKIPHLMIHWLQTYNLVIENCEFDKLELPNGRIGNITIKNTKFKTLDLTNTLAAKFEIDPPTAASGKIMTEGSNYPKGGYKIDGNKSK